MAFRNVSHKRQKLQNSSTLRSKGEKNAMCDPELNLAPEQNKNGGGGKKDITRTTDKIWTFTVD